jgi:surfeit locus 1 family protein
MFVLALLFFLVFSALSIWQVGRVFEKQDQLAQIEQANASSSLRVSRLSEQELLAHVNYRAKVRGRFLAEHCFFVENVIFKGKPGLYVYCPFKAETKNKLLLVNMGWLGKLRDRLQLPEYRPPQQTIEIDVVLSELRSKPVVTSGMDKPNIELDNLWAYFDFDSLLEQSRLEFYPLELRLLSSLEDELQRDWPRFEAKTGMHIGYAIHWAVFALVTLGLYIKLNLKRIEDE